MSLLGYCCTKAFGDTQHLGVGLLGCEPGHALLENTLQNVGESWEKAFTSPFSWIYSARPFLDHHRFWSLELLQLRGGLRDGWYLEL